MRHQSLSEIPDEMLRALVEANYIPLDVYHQEKERRDEARRSNSQRLVRILGGIR